MLMRLRDIIATEAFRRGAWLAGIVVVLGLYKITLTHNTLWTNIDGGYYLDVAHHVRDGRGLLTSCSILNAAFSKFPHPAAVYPLWPLLIGWFAKLFPIFAVGKWLATLCYFATLVFAYLWGASLYDKPLLPTVAPSFNAGHLLALMFGLHNYFFKFTSFPYTEGLTYAVTCAALWRMTSLLPRPGWRGGLEIGVWLGLVVLARYQLVLLAMAAFPVLAGAALLSSGPRRQYAVMTVCMAVGMLLVVGPHYWYVSSFTPNLTPGLYVQWQRVRFGDMLSPIPDVLEVKGAWPWLVDRANGLSLAFDARGKSHAYALRFYTFHYALVAVIPLLWSLAIRHATRVRSAWDRLRRPENLNWVFVVVFAVGCFVMIHSLHMDRKLYPEWYFAQRHALVCMFIFFLAMLLLFVQRRFPWKLLGVFFLCSSTYLGLQSIRSLAFNSEGDEEPSTSALVQWLNEEAAQRGGMVVALRQPQPIAYRTEGVGYHWYYRHTSFKDIEAMVKSLGAVYVIVPGKQTFAFTRAREFAKSFDHVRTLDGYSIYAPKPSLVPADP